MTDDLNTGVEPVGRTRTREPIRHGRAPVVTAGVMGVLLIPALIAGGLSAANAISTPRVAISAQPTEAPPIPDTGDQTPGSDDPSTPPDRDSDQTVVTPEEDTIYYIQRGDTLTALSAKFGMSIDYIADYNAVRDVNVINEGAVLRIPFIYIPPVPADGEAAPAVNG